MKKIILSILAVTAISLAFKPAGDVIGKAFPSIQCEDYNGKPVSIPDSTNGKFTLIGIAFSNDAEQQLKTWIEPVYNKFVEKTDRSKADMFDVGNDFDVNFYFIPRFNLLNQVSNKASKEKIKADTDKEMYSCLLFYKGTKSFKDDLDIEKKDVPYIFVLDKTGKITYFTSGKYEVKKFEKVLDAMEED